MDVALIYHPEMAEYRFPPGHPMRPERHSLAVELMRDWGMLADQESPGEASAGVATALMVTPEPATMADLELAHGTDYLRALQRASADPRSAESRYGLGEGDTPAVPGIFEASAMIAGATSLALEGVLDGRWTRAFSPAGGLHHAHHDRAAGFCPMNDAVVAIEKAVRAHPGLKVAYVDIDGHHGDGVQEAFWSRSDVLTLSVHESGMSLYPGTGAVEDVGSGDGLGFALNVPLAPASGDNVYSQILGDIIGPALRAFAPDVVVAQCGADSHRDDPLTHLDSTVLGFSDLVKGIIALSNELCDDRIVLLGGGGYEPFSAVPRMWAGAMASLLKVDIPSALPEAWLELSRAGSRAAGFPLAHADTFHEPSSGPKGKAIQTARDFAGRIVRHLRGNHPLLQGIEGA